MREMTKSKRFKVFHRDSFKCRYCGRDAQETTLEVDHIIPRSRGGGDDLENLATSCVDCNRGKSATPLEMPPVEDPMAGLERAQEMRELEATAEQLKQLRAAREALVESVLETLCSTFDRERWGYNNLGTLVKYCDEHGADLFFQWVNTACHALGQDADEDRIGRFISGCRSSHKRGFYHA